MNLFKLLYTRLFVCLTAVHFFGETAIAREIVPESRENRVRLRACEIQRRENQPPTFCYSNSSKAESESESELDSLCIKQSLQAQRLPRVDRYTSKRCREAIEKRAKDLAYAADGDALR